MPGPRGQYPTPAGLTAKIKMLKSERDKTVDWTGHKDKKWHALNKTLTRYEKLAGVKKAPPTKKKVSPGKKKSWVSEGVSGVGQLIKSATRLHGKTKAGLEKVKRASETPSRSDALNRPGKGISKESYERTFHPKKKTPS